MPFGLKNAAQTFQRFMDSVVRELPFVFVYLNNISVASFSCHKHRTHLQQVCQKLDEHGLAINLVKCQFSLTSIDFLGHCINQNGAVPLPNKVETIMMFVESVTVKEPQEFPGIVNFYHRFVPSAGRIMQPISKLLANKRKALIWDNVTTAAFNKA